eukprot:tig00020960_g16553.t1
MDQLCEQYLAALADRLVLPLGPLPPNWRSMPRAALQGAIAATLVRFLREPLNLPPTARWDADLAWKMLVSSIGAAGIAVYDSRACEILLEAGFLEDVLKFLRDRRARAPHAGLQDAVCKALEFLRAGCLRGASFRQRFFSLPASDLRTVNVIQVAMPLMSQTLGPLLTGDTLSAPAHAAARLLQEEEPAGWKAALKLLSGLAMLWVTSPNRGGGNDRELAQSFVAAAEAECRPRAKFVRRIMAFARGEVSGPWTPEEGRFLRGSALDCAGYLMDYPPAANLAIRGGCIGALRDLLGGEPSLARQARSNPPPPPPPPKTKSINRQ